RLGVARGTAQARLNKLLDSGVVRLDVSLDMAVVGYPIAGFATLAISQGSIGEVARSLADIPEVLEAHTVTGDGDVLVYLAAKSTDDLFYTIEQTLQSPAVQRTSTSISLVEHVPRRIGPLVKKIGEEASS
ncbi:MAG: Lrp/AsnC family transcriptional regulator, partial [Acidimicrobiia bacterium]|nr:Lrp/AsnC family transcriptional regulator [Acidimicrobiia bacterium]